MRLTLLESGRSLFQTAECAMLSILAHAGVLWLALSASQGGRQLPTDEREARVFFLLPPDRVDTRVYQSEVFQGGKLGLDYLDGELRTGLEGGWTIPERSHDSRRKGKHNGARSQIPFGPPPIFVPDTAFSVLEVDKIAERYDSSAAPIYPRELLALGMEGLVQAIYVVDTTGTVDTTTVEVVQSDDPRFTQSVRTALGQMKFRPAIRAGKTVRQLVQQRFRFKIEPPPQTAVKQVS
jgi:TonB family protein